MPDPLRTDCRDMNMHPGLGFVFVSGIRPYVDTA
jgi:hypothetical protein